MLKTIGKKSFMDQVLRKGDIIRTRLGELKARTPFIKDVRGMGLHIGVELDRPGIDLVKKALDAGTGDQLHGREGDTDHASADHRHEDHTGGPCHPGKTVRGGRRCAVKIPVLKTKDLVTVTDLSREEIMDIFRLAAKLKKAQKKGKPHEFLCGRSLAMIFEKSSTRTRVSFEVGMSQLGGHALFLGKDDIQLGRGETIGDTARVLSRYVDGIMIRTFSHAGVMELAKTAGVPVINGLTDSHHPCQALTDFFTIYETRKSFDGVKMAYVGDGNNMSNCLMLCAAILGADISVATPGSYAPDREAVQNAMEIAAMNGSRVEVTTDPGRAAEKADYIYTDVWVSMGQEEGAEERRSALAGYKISRALLEKCAPGCRVMHCLPAHRGEEIDADVMDSDMSDRLRPGGEPSPRPEGAPLHAHSEQQAVIVRFDP